MCHERLGEWGTAIEIGAKALIVNREASNLQFEINSLLALGSAYFGKLKSGDVNASLNAEQYYLQALDVFDEHDELTRFDQCEALMRLGELYLEMGDRDKSMNYLLRMLSLAEQHGITEKIFNAEQRLYHLYNREGNVQEALKHLERYSEMREKIFNQSSDARLHTLQVARMVSEAERKIESEKLRAM